MRIWQRSAIAFTVRPPVSSTRSRKTSVGDAAYGSERTPSAVKARSATRILPGHSITASAQAGEEGVDPLPVPVRAAGGPAHLAAFARGSCGLASGALVVIASRGEPA